MSIIASVYEANLSDASVAPAVGLRSTHSGEIFPRAGDMSTLMSDLKGLLRSLFSARAITALPPMECPSKLTPEVSLWDTKN